MGILEFSLSWFSYSCLLLLHAVRKKTQHTFISLIIYNNISILEIWVIQIVNDEFKEVDNNLLIGKYSSAERRRFLSCLYAMKDSLSKLLLLPSIYAQDLYSPRNSVIDDFERVKFIENEFSSVKQIRDRQIHRYHIF